MKIKYETLYIEDRVGKVWLPRPSSWIPGVLRHRWVEHTLKKKPTIAGPANWLRFEKEHGVKKLVEYEDGTWEIITYENQ